MIKKIKKYLAAALVLAAFGAPVLVPAVVSAQDDAISPGLCSGAELQFPDSGGTGAGCTNTQASGTKLTSLIKTIINIVSVIVGVVAVIMIVFGGLKYITSGGDSSNVSAAKNTIIYAIVGLVVVALAQFIVRFVLSKSLDATQ